MFCLLFSYIAKYFSSFDKAAKIDENPLEFNEKKRKLLGPGLQESFLHPKAFKIEKLTLPKNTEKKKSTKQSGGNTEVKKHRFNVV